MLVVSNEAVVHVTVVIVVVEEVVVEVGATRVQ